MNVNEGIIWKISFLNILIYFQIIQKFRFSIIMISKLGNTNFFTNLYINKKIKKFIISFYFYIFINIVGIYK